MVSSLTVQTGGSNALLPNCVQENDCVNVILNILTTAGKVLGCGSGQKG